CEALCGVGATMKIETIKYNLIKDFPYFARGISAMEFVEVDDLPHIAACDKYWKVYWSPTKLKEVCHYNTRMAEHVMLHELMHLILDHHGRAEKINAEYEIWAIAADLAVNTSLSEFGVSMPEGALYPEQFGLRARLTAEEYYYELLKKDLRHKKALPHGSGATNRRAPWEIEGGGVPPQEQKTLRKTIQAEAAKTFSRVSSGEFNRFVNEDKGKINWQSELLSCIRSLAHYAKGAQDYTFNRLSRRQAACEYRLPAMVQNKINIGVVVDTSGSITDREISRFLGEIGGICRAVTGEPIDVIAYDTELKGQKQIYNVRQLQDILRGGGGTAMDKAIELMAKKRRYDVIIVFTDGYTEWPKNPIPNVIVVCIGESGGPDWAKTIFIEDET
ncbi:MAG: VWA-like domain-containing protein, partial [Candidatus Hadarchaeum sp.]